VIEVNRPENRQPNVRCYKCKAEFYVHPMASMNAPYVTDCELHKSKCMHETSGPYFQQNVNEIIEKRCKHCGQFFR